MGGRITGVLVLPVLLAMLVGGIARLVDLFRTHGPARSARARSLGASTATAVAGFAAMAVWLSWDGALPEDVRLATLPALTCTVAVLTAGVAERTWPHPTGQVRVAHLASRVPWQPHGLGRLLVIGLVSSVVALVGGGVSAAPDGRSFSRHAGNMSSSGSPYPGPEYAVAVGIACALLALATWFALRQVEARPALGERHEALDRALREGSLVRALRPAAVGALLTATGLWLTLGATVNRVTQNLRMNDSPGIPEAPGDVVQDLGFAAVAVGVVMLVLALVALAWSSPRLPAGASGTRAPDPQRANA